MAGGERDPQRLSPWLSRLDALAVAAGLPSRVQSVVPPRPVPTRAGGVRPPAPAAPALLPRTVSASAYGSLIACPYQFHARHMLGLNEQDEVREEFEKRDYGTWVHDLLARLHARIPVFLDVAPEDAVAAFGEIADQVFAEAIAFNYLSLGWKTRVVALAPAYVKWQRERESQGWRWQAGEWQRTLPVPLASGSVVELVGRLDRVDRSKDGSIAILDYKTRGKSRLKKQVQEPGEDVQLAVYQLLQPEGPPAQAAYVAFDEDPVETVAANERHDVEDERLRLVNLLGAIESGAALPANAPESTCAWCEMRGLCRRDHWIAEGGDG
jgi:ATP-dependent helicase/nuclease subunit B